MASRSAASESRGIVLEAGTDPRFHFLIVAAVYSLAVLALAYPALYGQFLAGPHSDQYIAGYAFREFAAAHLRETGSFPLWNPYLFGGMPFVAGMHGDIFYPTFLLRLILRTDVAMTWGFIIHMILAGVFCYGFLRAAGLSFAGAMMGGLAYMLGGQLASLVSPGHDGKLFVSTMFPLSLWLLLLWVRGARAWVPGLLAVVVGLAVLSPHPQLLQYMLLAGGAYALYIAVRGVRAGELSRRDATVRLALALLAVALGGLIGAIQYIPVREYVAWSPRATGMTDYAHATSFAWPPEELLDVYLPQFSGILDAYWGRNFFHLHSQYVGASVLVLAFAAFIGARADARRSEIWFWTSALVIALLWALGGHTPFYRIPYAVVPGTQYFRAPATVFFVGALAIAYLTAIGTERLLRRQIGLRYLIGWGIAGVVIALLATVGALTGIAQTLAPEQSWDRVLMNRSAVVFGAWRSLAFVLAVAALAVLLLRGRLRERAIIWLLAGVMVLDLWSVMRHYWIFQPPAAQLYASDPTIEYLKAQDQPVRVLALPLQEEPRRDANIHGDGLMVHGIRTTLGYHGNQLRRYDILAGRGPRGYDNIGDPRFWELTNTRYLLSNAIMTPLPGAERVAGPATTSVGTTVTLLRFPGEQPYAWVAPLIVQAPDEAVLGTILDPRFNLRTAALFDTSANVRGVEDVRELPPPLEIDVRVTSYAPGRVSLALDTPAPEGAALVVAENYYPGWSATVDGQPAAVGRANFTLIGVELPAGGREVELVFGSTAYETGRLVTLLALGAALLWLAAGAVVARRSRGWGRGREGGGPVG